jgi:hypothetical protein
MTARLACIPARARAAAECGAKVLVVYETDPRAGYDGVTHDEMMTSRLLRIIRQVIPIIIIIARAKIVLQRCHARRNDDLRTPAHHLVSHSNSNN